METGTAPGSFNRPVASPAVPRVKSVLNSRLDRFSGTPCYAEARKP